MATDIKELRERREYAYNEWRETHDEGGINMRYVSGDPWDDADKVIRKDRPTVAPDELGQYFNAVINALAANPRGMKFSPTGNGASEQGAAFYEDKAREIEYRSHAQLAYLLAARNAIERGYGYLRVETRYASERSPNQDLWIEGFPDPDMVLPDPEAKRPDSSDMKFCHVEQWQDRGEAYRAHKGTSEGAGSSLTEDGWYNSLPATWKSGNSVLKGEYWCIETTKRKLLLVQPPAMPQMVPAGAPQPPTPPVPMFEDELEKMPGVQVLQALRTVDYPTVRMYLADGLDIIHEQDWLGKYIPIVSCYGKVMYVPEGGVVKRKIYGMTNLARAPFKSFAYACSQELEIIAMVPKAPIIAVRGSLGATVSDWEESPYSPKSVLYYDDHVQGNPEKVDPPRRLDFVQGEYLQGVQMVKESYRRSIQAAMGSNFLPTQAQQQNEKSGIALDNINRATSQGTYHFVWSHDAMIRQTGLIVEDLLDKIHDYAGETATRGADGKSGSQVINTPGNPKSISTKGDYLVTVNVGPSNDSQEQAAENVIDGLVGNLQAVAQLVGPQKAAAVLARSIKMKNLGPEGDALADLIDPPPPPGQQPPSPETQQLQQENQQLKSVLQRAAQEKQAKVVEVQGKYKIAEMQEQHEDQRAGADREVKLAVAELGAKIERMSLFMEERARVSAEAHDVAKDAAAASHELRMTQHGHSHEAALSAADAVHAERQGAIAHTQGLDAAQQAAALQPAPNGTGEA